MFGSWSYSDLYFEYCTTQHEFDFLSAVKVNWKFVPKLRTIFKRARICILL